VAVYLQLQKFGKAYKPITLKKLHELVDKYYKDIDVVLYDLHAGFKVQLGNIAIKLEDGPGR